MAAAFSRRPWRRFVPIGLGVFAVCLLPGLHGAGKDSPKPPGIVVSPSKVGNVFLVGEAVEIPIRAAGNTLEWAVADFWEREILTGSTEIKSGEAIVRFTPPGTGYYDIALTVRNAETVSATGHTRVAVVPGCDLAKITDSPFGVMTHFAAAWEPDLIPVFAMAGIKNVRDEVFWASVEQKKGVFEFPEKFEKYRSELARYHMKALTPLTFGNRLHDDAPGGPSYGIAPFSEAGIAAYGCYADEVLAHYGRTIEAVEIWNEYNGAFGRGPADGKASAYAKMLVPTYDKIKARRPDVFVLGCSTIGIPIGWIEEVFRHGGADHMDGVSIHPYGYLFQPEMHVSGLEALRSLIRKYNGGKDKPIWATEQGYYLTEPGSQGNRDPITEAVKARYLVRVNTVFLAHGVEKTFWYLGRNDDAFGTMGLVGKPNDDAGRYAALPVYSAFAELIHQLTDATFAAREQAPDGVYAFRFLRNGEEIRVLWSLRPMTVALQSAVPLVVTDLMGQSVTVQPVSGKVHLGLSDSPVYVHGRVPAISEQREIALSVPSEVAVGERIPVTIQLPKTVTGELEVGPATAEVTEGSHIALGPSGRVGERWIPYVLKAKGNVISAGAWKVIVRPEIVLDRFPRLVAPDVLQVNLENFSSEKEAEIESVRWEIGDTKQTRSGTEKIGARRSIELNLPISEIHPFTLYDSAVTLRLKGGREFTSKAKVSYNPVESRTVTVDGDLSDWEEAKGLDLAQATYKKLDAERTGDADLSGKVYLCWDRENLYLAARIRDDVFQQEHEGYSTWKGDGLQIGLTAAMPWLGGEWAGPVQEFGLALTKNGPEFYRSGGSGDTRLLPNVPLAIRRDRDTTIYECAIPWREIPSFTPEAGSFSFGVFVNDNDGHGRKGYLQWADIKELNSMQRFLLEKP